MDFSFDNIKDLFGKKEDFSVFRLQLAIKCPNISYKDVFLIFKMTCDNYHSKNDTKFDVVLSLRIGNNSPGMNDYDFFFSSLIFKNLYTLIDLNDDLDMIMQSKKLLMLFKRHKDKLAKKISTNRTFAALDLYEITCEFIELIESKKL